MTPIVGIKQYIPTVSKINCHLFYTSEFINYHEQH